MYSANAFNKFATRECYIVSNLSVAMSFRDSVIVKDPEILSGMPVCRGTRLLLHATFHYSKAGKPWKSFVQNQVPN